MLSASQLDISSAGPDQTIQLGYRLGKLLTPGHVICLAGELGAGKTTLVNGIAQGWGSEDRVTSPTFTLLNVYHRAADRQVLYHLDAYRLESAEAGWSIGLEDIFDTNGPVVIEWPERIKVFVPPEHLWIDIYHDQKSATRRQLVICAQGDICMMLLASFRQQVEDL